MFFITDVEHGTPMTTSLFPEGNYEELGAALASRSLSFFDSIRAMCTQVAYINAMAVEGKTISGEEMYSCLVEANTAHQNAMGTALWSVSYRMLLYAIWVHEICSDDEETRAKAWGDLYVLIRDYGQEVVASTYGNPPETVSVLISILRCISIDQPMKAFLRDEISKDEAVERTAVIGFTAAPFIVELQHLFENPIVPISLGENQLEQRKDVLDLYEKVEAFMRS